MRSFNEMVSSAKLHKNGISMAQPSVNANLISMHSSNSPSQRIVSMDQFRGYAVAGMFLVNFFGGLEVTHQLLRHNNTHFSWADSIMPGFLFACGFSYRLSILRKIPQVGRAATYAGILRRSMLLIAISLLMYGFGQGFVSWSELTPGGVSEFLARLLKANLWEVLAIIGACQILLLPVIEARPSIRFLASILLAVTHLLLSWSFNYEFVYGQPNWMDAYWGAAGHRAWDGGFFGLISWTIPMLAGSLVWDLVATTTLKRTLLYLCLSGVLLMGLGYGLSCLTRLYDIDPATSNTQAGSNPVSGRKSSRFRIAESPVLPPWENAKGKEWTDLLAEPPFVPPPSATQRPLNYWMMDKRVVTQSFIIFSVGFTCWVYAGFMLLCDGNGLYLPLFRTLGQNALVAYILHAPIRSLVLSVVPEDSPLAWTITGFAVFFLILTGLVRYLEKSNIRIRL